MHWFHLELDFMRKPAAEMTTGFAARPGVARRRKSSRLRKIAGGGMLVVLSILFWLIMYQNMPDNLNDMQFKPFSTQGAPDRFIKICMILISSIVIVSRWSQARQLAKALNPGLIAMVVLIPLSALWSIDPNATLLRFVTLSAIVLLCYAICLAGWDGQRFRQVAVPPVLFLLVISLVIGAMYPDRIIERGTDISQNNSWHGFTQSKNQFGMMASVVAILCVHGLLTPGVRKIWYLFGTGVALLCLALSRSSTSLLATMLGIAFIVSVTRVAVIRNRYSTHVTIAITALVLLYELVIMNLLPGVNTLLAPVMSLTGKDTTFSNRSVIWELIKEHIRGARLLGTGYGAYWTGPVPSSPSYVFMYVMYFYPTESHNGYLETVNDLGFVGLFCLLAFLFFYVRQALQLMRFDLNQAAMYLALLFQQMMANLSESEWFSRSLVCAILTLGAFCLSRDLLAHRQQARSGMGAATRPVPAPARPSVPAPRRRAWR
jgi:exopolysaccharide production protein ExoQ